MTEHEVVEQLLPWYGTGRVSAEERGRIEEHLASCAECREVLEQVREHASVLSRRSVRSLTRHVDPVLLTEFAERPETLDAETRRWIEAKLRECETCREANARLHEVERSLAPAKEAAVSRRWNRFWAGLRASVLHPVPALAYLLLLALVAPLALRRDAGGRVGDAAPMSTAPFVTVTGESAVREGEGSSDGAEPLVLRLPAERNHALVVVLATSLVESDLREGKLPLQVELRRGGAVLWSQRVGPDDLRFRDSRAELPLVLRGDALGAGTDYEVELRVVLPGDPLDGQALFRRRLVMEDRR